MALAGFNPESLDTVDVEAVVTEWQTLGTYLTGIVATGDFEEEDAASLEFVEGFARAVERSDDELRRALSDKTPETWTAFTRQVKNAWNRYIRVVQKNGIAIDLESPFVIYLELPPDVAALIPTPTVVPPTATAVPSPTVASATSESARAATSTPILEPTAIPSPAATAQPTATVPPTATPQPTATPRPTSTPRPTPTTNPTAGWPSSVAALVEQDSKTDCDEIAWTLLSATGSDPDIKFLSCVGPAAYAGYCSTTSGSGYFTAPSGYIFVVCAVGASNFGSSEVIVSPFDFALIDGSNRKYELDFTAMALFDTPDLLDTTTLRNGQSTNGWIGFAVPTSFSGPLRLEIDPLLNLTGDVGTIILEPLLDLDD